MFNVFMMYWFNHGYCMFKLVYLISVVLYVPKLWNLWSSLLFACLVHCKNVKISEPEAMCMFVNLFLFCCLARAKLNVFCCQ